MGVANIFDHITPALEDLAYEAITPCQLTIDSSDIPDMDIFLTIGRLKVVLPRLGLARLRLSYTG